MWTGPESVQESQVGVLDIPDLRPGRPPRILPQDTAASALQALEREQRSYRAVAIGCGTSPPWLYAAHKEGRLREMAEGRMGKPTGP